MVKFKPTELGLRVLKARYHRQQEWLDRYTPSGRKAAMPTPDEDGWYKEQLWVFMKIFGEHMEMAFDPIGTTIMVYTSDSQKGCCSNV